MSQQITDFHKNLREFFKSKGIRDLVGEKRTVLSFQHVQSIESCIEQLSEHGVRSAPLEFQTAGGSSESTVDTKVDFIDFMDIVSYLSDFCEENGEENVLETEELYKTFMQTPAKEIANHAQLDRYEAIGLDTTAYDAAHKILADDKDRIKRLIVLDSNGSMVNIVTLSDILQLMKVYIDQCHSDTSSAEQCSQLNLTVDELKVSTAQPKFVTEDQSALDAFRVMLESKQSFVPVVSSDENVLLSVISVRDIKVVVSAHARAQFGNSFKALGLSVMDFVGLTRQASSDDKYPYISCKGSDTIETVVKRLRATHVHRLLLIDENKLPIGGVNVRGVCRQIVE